MDYTSFIEDAAVISRDTFISIEEDLDTDAEKAEAYRLIIFNYLTDSLTLSNNKHISTIVRMCRTGQVGTMLRHREAAQNGAAGGQATKIDHDKVVRLKQQGYTQNQIGKELNCSDRQIRRIIAETKDIKPDTDISGQDIDPDMDISGHNLKTKILNKNINQTTILNKNGQNEKKPTEENESVGINSSSHCFDSISNSDSNSYNESDVVNLLVEICGYENEKHIFNTLNKQLFSTGYSANEVYRLLDQYREDITNAIEAPSVECYGEDRAIAIAIGIVKKKKPNAVEVMKTLAKQRQEEINNSFTGNNSDDNEWDDSDIPF